MSCIYYTAYLACFVLLVHATNFPPPPAPFHPQLRINRNPVCSAGACIVRCPVIFLVRQGPCTCLIHVAMKLLHGKAAARSLPRADRTPFRISCHPTHHQHTMLQCMDSAMCRPGAMRTALAQAQTSSASWDTATERARHVLRFWHVCIPA